MRVAVVLFLLLAGTSDSQAKRVKGVKSLDDKDVHLDHTLRLNVPIGSGCVPSCLLHSTSEHPHQGISLSQADR